MTGKLAPTAKVSSVGASGIIVTVALQLLQQYAPHFTLPSASTISGILTILVTIAGWVTKEEPSLEAFVLSHEKPVAGQVVVHNGPAANPPASAVVNDWGKD